MSDEKQKPGADDGAVDSRSDQSTGSPRFIVMLKSISSHCCFEASVLDTTKPHIFRGKHYADEYGKHYDAICECFNEEDARNICAVLNKANAKDEGRDDE